MVKTLFSRLVAIVVLTIVCSFILATPVSAQTSAWSGVCIYDSDVATIQGLQCLVANILSMIISLIGIAGFIMIIIGSFRYLLSGGNTKETEQARNTLTYAIIGLVVALSAFILLNLIANFTGVTSILNFKIPGSN